MFVILSKQLANKANASEKNVKKYKKVLTIQISFDILIWQLAKSHLTNLKVSKKIKKM